MFGEWLCGEFFFGVYWKVYRVSVGIDGVYVIEKWLIVSDKKILIESWGECFGFLCF